MPWGSLSAASQIRIKLELLGSKVYQAGMDAASAATTRFAGSVEASRKEMEMATRRSWLYSQSMYTARRYAFYSTLAITALGAAVLHLGYKYYAARQTAQVAFKTMLGSIKAVNQEIDTLTVMAAKSPFQFPDIVAAARRLQPFTKNIDLTNKLVMSTLNALSAMGNITSASLQRASLMLSHMFVIGRLTGQVLYNLGRDNIPMVQALEKHFHATGEQIRTMVAGGLIDATTAAKAFNDYIQSNPTFRGAAVAQATRTLPGAISTLKDLIGFGMANSASGLFGSLTRAIGGLDKIMIKAAEDKKHLTFSDVVVGIDKALTGHSHLIINTFTLMTETIRTFIIQWLFMIKLISLAFRPLDMIFNAFGANIVVMKIMGALIGTLITLWTIIKLKQEAYLIIVELTKLAQSGLVKSLIASTIAMVRYMFATTATETAISPLTGELVVQTSVVWGLTASVTALTAALMILSGIGIIAVGVYLVFTKQGQKILTGHYDIVPHTGIGFLDSALHYVGLQKNKNSGNKSSAAVTTNHKSSGLSKWLFGFPGLATGGTGLTPGWAVVGEHGPEMRYIPKAATVAPLDSAGAMMGGHWSITVKPQPIYLNGKQIAEVHAEVITDKEARL